MYTSLIDIFVKCRSFLYYFMSEGIIIWGEASLVFLEPDIALSIIYSCRHALKSTHPTYES